MLYLIGLGLCGVKDLTIRGLEALKRCDSVYLETYTSLCMDSPEAISEFLGKPVKVATRKTAEEGADVLLKEALEKDVGLLIIGDPLSATTHVDMMYRAKRSGVSVQVIHNTSIVTAVAACGLQLYRFGETVSIVSWTDSWKPESFYDKILANFQRDLHTLCLLDIKIKELSIEGLLKNKEIYQPDFCQSAKEAANILLTIMLSRRHNITQSGFESSQSLTGSSLCVVCSRIGWEDQKISSLSLEQLSQINEALLGGFPHCLVISACTLHPCEEEFLNEFTHQ